MRQIDMLPVDRLVPYIRYARIGRALKARRQGRVGQSPIRALISWMRKISTIGSTGDGSNPAAT